jgi:hypothetical protein
MRELVRRSEAVERQEPSAAQPAGETYQRFLAVTGLGPARPDQTDTVPPVPAA